MGYIRKMEVQAPIGRVWEAFTTASQLDRWLAPRVNVRFEPGGPYELFWGETSDMDSTPACRVQQIIPGRSFRIGWAVTGDYGHLFAQPLGETAITVAFEEGPMGTMVRVEQAETRDLQGWPAYDEAFAEVWEQALVNLKAWVEQAEPAGRWPLPL